MSELENERVYPFVFQMNSGNTCAGFILHESPSVLVISWMCRINFIKDQARYEIRQVMEAFLPVEVPIQSISMFQVLRPNIGLSVAYATYLAELNEQAKSDPNGSEYFDHEFFEDTQMYIDDADPLFRSHDTSGLGIRQAVNYRILLGTDPEKAKVYLEQMLSGGEESAVHVRAESKASCKERVVMADFRTRTILPSGNLDESGAPT